MNAIRLKDTHEDNILNILPRGYAHNGLEYDKVAFTYYKKEERLLTGVVKRQLALVPVFTFRGGRK